MLGDDFVSLTRHVRFNVRYNERVRTWLGRFAMPMPSEEGAGEAMAVKRASTFLDGDASKR